MPALLDAPNVKRAGEVLAVWTAGVLVVLQSQQDLSCMRAGSDRGAVE